MVFSSNIKVIYTWPLKPLTHNHDIHIDKITNMWQDFTIPSDKFGYCRMKSISPDIKAFVAYRSKLHRENENFNKSIDELLIPMLDHWQYSNRNNGFKTNSHALIATITVTSIWLLALSCYTCRKTPCLRVCYSCGTCIIKSCLCKKRRHRGKQKVFFRRLERRRSNLGNIAINDPTDNQDHMFSDQYITRSI